MTGYPDLILDNCLRAVFKKPDTMSAQSDSSHTAQVLDMVSLLDAPSRKRVVAPMEEKQSAILLSIRQNLSYQACVGVNDIDQLKIQCSHDLADAVMHQVRGFLYTEFGKLRVHRYRQVFTVGHQSEKGLIGGLLRVQFHARQVELPAVDNQQEPGFLSLSWGVGESVLEAEHERRLRQRLKN